MTDTINTANYTGSRIHDLEAQHPVRKAVFAMWSAHVGVPARLRNYRWVLEAAGFKFPGIAEFDTTVSILDVPSRISAVNALKLLAHLVELPPVLDNSFAKLRDRQNLLAASADASFSICATCTPHTNLNAMTCLDIKLEGTYPDELRDKCPQIRAMIYQLYRSAVNPASIPEMPVSEFYKYLMDHKQDVLITFRS